MLIGVKEVQQRYKVGRPTAERLLEECPATLPRKKGEMYRVDAYKFDEFIKEKRK